MSADTTVNRDYFRRTTVILAWIAAVYFYYWLAFPAVNTPFTNMGPQGIPVNHTYFLTWWTLFLLLFNGLLPPLMFWITAQPDSLLRTDVHLITVILATIGNVIAFLGIWLIGWFWCNTVISGAATGCNAVEYCCTFASAVPSECPSLVACSGLVVPDPLPWFDYWTQHLWLSLGFAILAVFGWAVNYDLRVSGLASSINTREARVLAALVLVGTSVAFYWFTGFVAPNVSFPHGHLVFDIPISPGPFTSTLYNYQWIAVYLLHANALPIVLLAFALMFYRTGLAAAIHLRFTAYIVAVINIGVLLLWVFVLIFQTNDWLLFSSVGSISNDDAYCCERFADYPDFCPNVVPCIQSHTLGVNPVFVSLIWATLFFIVTSIVHVVINGRLVVYGLLYPNASVEDDEKFE